MLLARSAPERLPVELPAAVGELVDVLAATGEAEWSAAERLAAEIPTGPDQRPIWLSTRAVEAGIDAPWLRVAIVGGWAVFRDPADGPSAPTFLWARPTVAIGRESELVDLLEAVAALAPERRAERWRSRRLARLDTLIVEPGEASGAIEAALGRLGLAPRVVRVPAGEW